MYESAQSWILMLEGMVGSSDSVNQKESFF